MKTPIDAAVINGLNWADGIVANEKLHDMLSILTGGDALGIVEQVPGEGFEAWRQLNERYNTVGEMYTLDKMN